MTKEQLQRLIDTWKFSKGTLIGFRNNHGSAMWNSSTIGFIDQLHDTWERNMSGSQCLMFWIENRHSQSSAVFMELPANRLPLDGFEFRVDSEVLWSLVDFPETGGFVVGRGNKSEDKRYLCDMDWLLDRQFAQLAKRLPEESETVRDFRRRYLRIAIASRLERDYGIRIGDEA